MDSIGQKTCRTCGATKEVSTFRRNANYWDGYTPDCKQCLGVKDKERRVRLGLHKGEAELAAQRIASGKQVCRKCHTEKPLTSEFFKPKKTSRTGFLSTCRTCTNAAQRKPPKPVVILTEKPCTKCGVVKPYTSEFFGSRGNGKLQAHCRECRDAAKKQWDIEHKQECIEYRLRRRGLDPFTYRAKKKLSRTEKKLRHARRVRNYKVKNPEVRAACAHNQRSKELGIPGRLTTKELRELYEQQDKRCPHCDRDLTVVGRHLDHVIPLDRVELGPTNNIDNVMWTCGRCNLDKHARTLDEWVNRWYYSPELLALESIENMSQGQILQ